MENPEKLTTQGAQDDEKQDNTICVGHQYAQANTQSVNET